MDFLSFSGNGKGILRTLSMSRSSAKESPVGTRRGQRIAAMMQVEFKKRRHHSLIGRIDMALMRSSFKAVKRNRGVAGVDKQSISMFEQNLEGNLELLMRQMKTNLYWSRPLLRAYIPKSATQVRPLGIPAVRDRVAQEAARAILEKVLEPLFHSGSHGFIKKRSCHTAMQQLVTYFEQGYVWVVDADIKGFFDNICQTLIMNLLKREISDSSFLRLIEKFLQAGVMEDGKYIRVQKGTPQGGVISPLLANLVLNHLDWVLEKQGLKFVRYADDFIVLTKSKSDAEGALVVVRQCIEQDLGLTLHPEKTKITSFAKGFNFLGYAISSRTIRMSKKAEDNFKDAIRKNTIRHHNLDTQVVENVNRVIRGVVNYFYTPFTTNLAQFNRLDSWIRKRIRCMKYKRINFRDNRRMTNKRIRKLGFLTCRELCLAV
jgi:RNA-directed DNA polymerase